MRTMVRPVHMPVCLSRQVGLDAGGCVVMAVSAFAGGLAPSGEYFAREAPGWAAYCPAGLIRRTGQAVQGRLQMTAAWAVVPYLALVDGCCSSRWQQRWRQWRRWLSRRAWQFPRAV